MNEHKSQPFKSLGTHLKYLREQHNESVAEVSAAVEIDADVLERIEQGQERPAEDILFLLINHFNMQEHEAVRLWDLAGYDKGDRWQQWDDGNAASGKGVVMLMAMDMRTMYSDGVQITATKAGITINFTQSGGPQAAVPVARVGMSIDQAQNVLNTLQQAVLQARYGGPKQLPPSQGK